MWNFAFRFCVLRWVYDRVVDHFTLGLFAVGVFGAASGFVLRGISGSQPQEVVIVTVVLAVAAFLLLRWKRFADLKNTLEISIKSFIYRFARRGMPLGGAPELSSWAQLLVSESFLSISYKRNDQVSIAEQVAFQLKQGKRLFVIEGDSGVGKTAAAIVIIDRLMCDSDLSCHARKIYYLDLAVHGERLERLIRQANSNFLRNASLIIDNFHRIPSRCIEGFNELVQPSRLQCKMVLVLSQPREYITLCPEHAIGPFKLAEREKTAFCISPPEPRGIHAVFRQSVHFSGISLALNTMDIPNASPLRWLAHINLERLYQLAFDDLDRAVESVLLMRMEDIGRPENRDLLRILAVISALAIHRGAFTVRDLRLCLRTIAQQRFLFSREALRLKKYFHRLRRQGLVIEAIGQRRVYVFHQALAEHLKDCLNVFSEFTEAFKAAGEAIMQTRWVSQDPLMSWLYAVELGDDKGTSSGFSQAMFTGAYGTMRRALLRNPPDSSKMELTYERAILAERIGDWTEARKGLASASADSEGNRNGWAWATIAAVEAEHAHDSCDRLRGVIRAWDLPSLPKLAARYWLVHMDAHRGIFDIDILWQLADELESNKEEFCKTNKFEFVHISRRILFDCARFMYLTGDSDTGKLHDLFQRPLALFLQDNHPCYEAYRQKFFIAHSLHYQYLYEIGLLKKDPAVDKELLRELHLSPFSDINKDRIAVAAIDTYQSAMERFAVFGDKTAEYIRPRLLEVQLTQEDVDLDRIFISITKYTAFITLAGIADMRPYPHIYLFKYYMRKARKMLTEVNAALNPHGHCDAFDTAFRRAEDALREAKAAFEAVENYYGTAMCRLFEAILMLFDVDTHEQARSLLIDLSNDAKRMKYRRIEEVAAIMKSPNLAPHDLYTAIAYFPFVHQ